MFWTIFKQTKKNQYLKDMTGDEALAEADPPGQRRCHKEELYIKLHQTRIFALWISCPGLVSYHFGGSSSCSPGIIPSQASFPAKALGWIFDSSGEKTKLL